MCVYLNYLVFIDYNSISSLFLLITSILIELHVNMLLDLKQISEEQFFAFNECSSHSCLVHHVSALEDKTLSEVRDNIASLRNSEGIHALMNIYWKIVTMF